MNLQKIQLKWKTLRHFVSVKQHVWRKFFRTFLHFWNKHFWMEVYSNLQTFAFQVFWECSSWATRNGVVQLFFETPTRKMFLAVLWEYIFNNGGFRIQNFQGNWRNSKWNFHELIKNNMEFPQVIKKKSYRTSRGLGFSP